MDPVRKDDKFTNADFAKSELARKLETEEAREPLPETNVVENAPQPARPQLVTPQRVKKETRVETTRGEIRGETRGETRREARGPEPKPRAEIKNTPLFPENELQEMRARWDKIQTAFVDQPRQAVEDADQLVAQAIQRLTDQFAAERSNVERQWSSGESVSTEILRQSLRRYRAFFERLLSA